jgi:hypothetical protein
MRESSPIPSELLETHVGKVEELIMYIEEITTAMMN